MDEEILEKLLTKLIGLTEFGALRWHFAGDVSKAYVTVFKDARLKLTEQALDITEAESDTVRIDARLHSETLRGLISGLHKAARESSSKFRTGEVKTLSASSSLANTCQRLLSEEKPGETGQAECLICNAQFDEEKSVGHLSHPAVPPLEKPLYICVECVDKLGVSDALARLNQAVYGSDAMSDKMNDTMSDTMNDSMRDTLNETLRDGYTGPSESPTQRFIKQQRVQKEQENL